MNPFPFFFFLPLSPPHPPKGLCAYVEPATSKEKGKETVKTVQGELEPCKTQIDLEANLALQGSSVYVGHCIKARSEELSSAPRGPSASSFQWEHSGPTKCWKCGPICWICGRAPWSSPPCCSPPLITFAVTFRCLQGNKTVAQCDKRKWFISWFAAQTAVKHCVDSYFLHQQWQNQREARKETERAPHVSTQCLLDGGATYVASKRYAEGNEGWWVCWVDGWPWCS